MSSQEIKAAVKKIVGLGGAMDRAIVLSVDKNEATCTVQLVADDVELDGVKLKPVINDGDLTQMGIIMYPAKDSFVIIGQIDGDDTDLYVLGTTVVESIALATSSALKLLITEDGKLNLNAVQMVFNNGDNGGVPLLKPLVKAIADLQKKYNDLYNAYLLHKHTGVQTDSGTSLFTDSPGPGTIDSIIKESDIANPIISQ